MDQLPSEFDIVVLPSVDITAPGKGELSPASRIIP